MNNESQSDARRLLRSAGLCAMLLIAAFFVWTDHRTHALDALPYLLLLACPVIHLLMHRGHGHGGRGRLDREHKHEAQP